MSKLPTPLQLCANSNVKFGTSGVRGLVTELTKEICQGFTQAFLSRLCKEKTLCIGLDLRPSSPLITDWIIEQAQKMGVDVLDCGTLPTPALAFYAMQHSLAAIMVTGSHIPFDRNGMKFYLPTGEISKADEHIILETNLDALEEALAKGQYRDCAREANTLYQERYLKAFAKLNLQGKRIGVYQHSCVTRDLLTELLHKFGAEVIELGRTDHFVALDTEAVGEAEKALARQWASRLKLDAIVTTDGDGDRPLVADELGQWLRGDQVGILTCQTLQATHIATPINSNAGLEQQLPHAKIVRTKIGSPFVIEAMQQATAQEISLGFEANGGVLLGTDIEQLSSLPTRDAILPILSVLSALQEQTLSSLVEALPKRYSASSRIQNIDREACQQLLQQLINPDDWQLLLSALYTEHSPQITSINTLDGVRTTLENGDILHIRASGNADELRIYSESNNLSRADKNCATAKDILPSLFFDI